MKSYRLLFMVALLINFVTSAPYVQHLDEDPVPKTDLNTGPEKTKLEPSATSLLRELFGFMDVLMDPQNYRLHSNMTQVIVKTFKSYDLV